MTANYLRNFGVRLSIPQSISEIDLRQKLFKQNTNMNETANANATVNANAMANSKARNSLYMSVTSGNHHHSLI